MDGIPYRLPPYVYFILVAAAILTVFIARRSRAKAAKQNPNNQRQDRH